MGFSQRISLTIKNRANLICMYLRYIQSYRMQSRNKLKYPKQTLPNETPPFMFVIKIKKLNVILFPILFLCIYFQVSHIDKYLTIVRSRGKEKEGGAKGRA